MMSSTAAARKNREFDPNTFLAMIGDARKILAVPKKQTIFTQGDEADAVFYVQKGKVRLTSSLILDTPERTRKHIQCLIVPDP